ncbi:NUDIX hydrolase [Paracoccus marinaquae]|uniref:NUDIX hydrolase n=1 Tax=Paracoccus marinaquae TaxID=2841926 RepID=A0ABS6AE21_9RHOB|nr:NUDIX hydrolase [Paracoccus marinaquae]MBU3028845.1 NUDIX hydrolase [Paracoccus marinaquae]
MSVLRNSLRILIGKRPPPIQVGALCIDDDTGQVLLITSRGTGRWIIPKGWPMEGRTLPGAAAQEAWEEAGVKGRVSHEEIGRYTYDKDQDSGFTVPVEVRVFPLQVASASKAFPEADERRRRWFDPADAAEQVEEPGLQQIIRRLVKVPRAG